MSALGTLLAAIGGVVLALPASRSYAADGSLARTPVRLLLNVLRSIPELVWAALLLISAGLGPLAGTLALAMHTTGVLGRLFAEAIENAPPAPSFALRRAGRARGASVSLRDAAPSAAADFFLHALSLGEQHSRGGGAGRGRRRRLGPDAGLSYGPFPYAGNQLGAHRHANAGCLVDLLSYVTRRTLAR